jgi:hypothetical protein
MINLLLVWESVLQGVQILLGQARVDASQRTPFSNRHFPKVSGP